ncbi:MULTISPECIES: hypothetical protein [Vibrio]|uniref:hypothetical protein n=1 Tax=Vibrio TaxID=662 RepID=UPI0004DAC7E5|nr:hypothetical protein [Vibrio parahaemolyticus]EGQ7682488.1 hypothetical protein [Vibrio parahaemolyticus]EGQ8047207.1 hypothetical protein [Vibrio parahaemolyticus]EHH2866199.1 hypothetical protein [Vibrio parahaemolyticus]EIO4097508.1 hypothetical protein [Vibrio parahaemolyticus]EJA7354874.1 hypothetical protein [Vibrio parahaemolyticus]
MLKPVKKVQQDSELNHSELTHTQLLREVGSLDEYRREQLKDQEYQEAADQRLNAIREKMKQHEQTRLASQEQALLEQSERERKRREVLEQLGGGNE